ncbi:MAG: TOMM precursor leader peptide-binding protein [Halobacteria archaeon]
MSKTGNVVADIPFPKLNPAFVPIKIDSDTVCLRAGPWSGPTINMVDEDSEHSLMDLIEMFDGTNHVKDILSEFSPEERDELTDLIRSLHSSSILYNDDGSSPSDAWPNLVLSGAFGAEQHENLESSSPLVVSKDGLGEKTVSRLLDVGVGGVTCTGEAVSTELAEKDLVRTVGFDELEREVDRAEYILYVSEKPRPKLLEELNKLCHEYGTPWSIGQILGFDGMVGPTVFPGETACYRCFEERTLANLKESSRETYRRYLREFEEDNLSTVTLEPFSDLVVGYLVMDAVYLLGYGHGFTVGRSINVSGLDLSVDVNDVLRLPRCDVCGKEQGRDFSRIIDAVDIPGE